MGPQLKFIGYDAIILEGKADTPCYISIVDDQVEIKDASHL
ncbi:aldehyde ferredoxin oxidoreductase N-terminal domain-containing protein [Saccharicrinis sp. GN24d3]